VQGGVQAALAAAGLQLSRMLIVDTSLRCWGSHHLPRVLLQLSRMLIVDTSLRCWGSHHLPRVLLAERYLFFPDPAQPTTPGEVSGRLVSSRGSEGVQSMYQGVHQERKCSTEN
jgi:hypothetical protein